MKEASRPGPVRTLSRSLLEVSARGGKRRQSDGGGEAASFRPARAELAHDRALGARHVVRGPRHKSRAGRLWRDGSNAGRTAARRVFVTEAQRRDALGAPFAPADFAPIEVPHDLP